MEQPVRTLLAGWESFYVIAGSVAGALIGLQFVVMALVAESRRQATSPEIAAFGTPTVLHFSAALFLSALLSMPWTAPSGLQFVLGGCGVAGVGYALVVIGRARRTKNYQPVFEDWLWHAALPLIAYLALTVAAALFSRYSASALGLIAGVTLGLVFIGIHNAWDTITYIVVDSEHRTPGGKRSGGRSRE
jgi:hypothetical protein